MEDRVSKNKENATRIVIGKSLSKRNIECLKMTYPCPNKKKDIRKAIIVLARQHPG